MRSHVRWCRAHLVKCKRPSPCTATCTDCGLGSDQVKLADRLCAHFSAQSSSPRSLKTHATRTHTARRQAQPFLLPLLCSVGHAARAGSAQRVHYTPFCKEAASHAYHLVDFISAVTLVMRLGTMRVTCPSRFARAKHPVNVRAESVSQSPADVGHRTSKPENEASCSGAHIFCLLVDTPHALRHGFHCGVEHFLSEAAQSVIRGAFDST